MSFDQVPLVFSNQFRCALPMIIAARLVAAPSWITTARLRAVMVPSMKMKHVMATALHPAMTKMHVLTTRPRGVLRIVVLVAVIAMWWNAPMMMGVAPMAVVQTTIMIVRPRAVMESLREVNSVTGIVPKSVLIPMFVP